MNTMFKSDNAFCARQVRKAVRATGLKGNEMREFQELLLDYGRKIKTCDRLWSAEKKALNDKDDVRNGSPKLSAIAVELQSAYLPRDAAAEKVNESICNLGSEQQDAFFGKIIKMNVKTNHNAVWALKAAVIGAFAAFVASLYSQFWVAAGEAVLAATAAKARRADKTAANLLVTMREADEKKFDACWIGIAGKQLVLISENSVSIKVAD